jgi:transposase InsO family protein
VRILADGCPQRIPRGRTAAASKRVSTDAVSTQARKAAQGSKIGQYTALRYVERLTDAGALAFIGTVGDSYDNALAESTNGLYRAECVYHDGPFRTVQQLELATADWVAWFNTARLHSSINYLTPIEFEAAYYAALASTEAA